MLYDNDLTAPPRDFSRDHDLLEARWGWPPTIVPRRSPYEQSRPTDPSPGQQPDEPTSLQALSRRRGQSTPGNGARP